MNRTKSITFQILSYLFLAVVAMLGVQNMEQTVPVTVLSFQLSEIPLGALLLIVSGLGAAAMFFKLFDINLNLQSQVKQYEHRREKAEVKAQTNSDQVKALEAKIQTLEKALEKALSSSQSKSGS